MSGKVFVQVFMCVYTVWVKKKFTPRKLLIIFKMVYEQWIIIHLIKECVIPNHLVSLLCGMCSRLDERKALFDRMRKSTCAKVMPKVAEWENELNVSNEMHCIWFLQKQKSHTHTHTHTQTRAHKMLVDIWFSIFDVWCGMINFVRDVICFCKNRINT